MRSPGVALLLEPRERSVDVDTDSSLVLVTEDSPLHALLLAFTTAFPGNKD